MTETLKQRLVCLANEYETASFCDNDPSQFLRWYDFSRIADVECASFIAAMLAFGARTQFLSKIRAILQTADETSGSISAWLAEGAYKTSFLHGEKRFYRFYSYDDMQTFFSELASVLEQAVTPGEFFRKKYNESECPLPELIASAFPESRLVPKGKNCANKRIHMFLRWMVRRSSPVDLGLWTWILPSDLLIPLDVHVLQEAVRMELLPPNASATRKTAERLTAAMNEVFPGDPARADFALFGLGVAATGLRI